MLMSFCPPAPHRLPSAEPLFQGTLPCHQPAGRRKFKNKNKKKQKDPKNAASQAAVDASSLRGSLVNSTTTASYAAEIWGQAPGGGQPPAPPHLAILLHQPLRLTRSGDPRGGQHSPQPINILADSICLYTGSFILPVCLSRISVRVFPYGSLPCSVAGISCGRSCMGRRRPVCSFPNLPSTKQPAAPVQSSARWPEIISQVLSTQQAAGPQPSS